jgi:hypothetical protein
MCVWNLKDLQRVVLAVAGLATSKTNPARKIEMRKI